MKFSLNHIDELVGAIIVTLIVWGIGVSGLELVQIEGNLIHASGINKNILLILAPLFLGVMSYFLVKWSQGYKGPAELIAVLKLKSSEFPGWVKATITWIIACIELGTGLSPKGFEGPYIAAAGGLSGFLATKFNLDAAARRRLARCGLGVAFSLLFRTPLGGFICMFEFGGFERSEFFKQLLPALIAASVSMWLSSTTHLPLPFAILHVLTLNKNIYMVLLLLGIVTGLISLAYVTSIQLSRKLFKQLEHTIPFVTIPVLGALISTSLGFFFPIILGSNELDRAFTQASPVVWVAIGAIIAKVIATAAADGSKMAGGTVGPAILLGGLVGRFVGGADPLFATAGAAALIGPIAGIPLTMLVTGATWLGFASSAWLIIIPIVIAKIMTWGIELYTFKPTEKKHIYAYLWETWKSWNKSLT